MGRLNQSGLALNVSTFFQFELILLPSIDIAVKRPVAKSAPSSMIVDTWVSLIPARPYTFVETDHDFCLHPLIQSYKQNDVHGVIANC